MAKTPRMLACGRQAEARAASSLECVLRIMIIGVDARGCSSRAGRASVVRPMRMAALLSLGSGVAAVPGPMVGLDQTLKGSQLVVPVAVEVSDPAAELAKRFGLQRVPRLPSDLALAHETGVRQNAQVLGHGRAAHGKKPADDRDRKLILAQQLKQLAPRRVGYRLEHVMPGRGR